MSEPTTEPPVETTEERLRRLEQMVATMHPGLAPDGYAPPAPPTGPVIPLSLLVNTAVDPVSARRQAFGQLPVFREIKLVIQMYLDPRYRLSRIAQLGVPLLIVFAVLNYCCFAFIFPSIPFLSQVSERLLLLVVGAALAVILNREAMRYQAVLDYLARTGR